MKKLQNAVTAKKIAPQHMPSLLEVYKLRAYDDLFFDFGVEQEDIDKASLKYNLTETAEFKEMMAVSKIEITEPRFRSQAKMQGKI